MFKMGCTMAKKILAIDGKGSLSSQNAAGSSNDHRNQQQHSTPNSSKKSKDKQANSAAAMGADSGAGGGGGHQGKTKASGDELNDFSKLEDDPRIPLNVRQIFKITKSWKAIARTMSKTGTAMFLNLFEQNQDLFYLFDRFQHLKGKDLHESMELREHAATVMSTLDHSISSLSDYDNFVTYLHSIGKLHRKVPGFKRDHFWKIEQPFLKAVKQTLDERCNETIEEIYKIAIKLIIETIADGYGDDQSADQGGGADQDFGRQGQPGGGGGGDSNSNGDGKSGGGGGKRGGGGGGSGKECVGAATAVAGNQSAGSKITLKEAPTGTTSARGGASWKLAKDIDNEATFGAALHCCRSSSSSSSNAATAERNLSSREAGSSDENRLGTAAMLQLGINCPRPEVALAQVGHENVDEDGAGDCDDVIAADSGVVVAGCCGDGAEASAKGRDGIILAATGADAEEGEGEATVELPQATNSYTTTSPKTSFDVKTKKTKSSPTTTTTISKTVSDETSMETIKVSTDSTINGTAKHSKAAATAAQTRLQSAIDRQQDGEANKDASTTTTLSILRELLLALFAARKKEECPAGMDETSSPAPLIERGHTNNNNKATSAEIGSAATSRGGLASGSLINCSQLGSESNYDCNCDHGQVASGRRCNGGQRRVSGNLDEEQEQGDLDCGDGHINNNCSMADRTLAAASGTFQPSGNPRNDSRVNNITLALLVANNNNNDNDKTLTNKHDEGRITDRHSIYPTANAAHYSIKEELAPIGGGGLMKSQTDVLRTNSNEKSRSNSCALSKVKRLIRIPRSGKRNKRNDHNLERAHTGSCKEVKCRQTSAINCSSPIDRVAEEKRAGNLFLSSDPGDLSELIKMLMLTIASRGNISSAVVDD